MLRGYSQRGINMADVFDVAKYILQKQGSMTTMKLQKLVYYCQAWALVWDAKKLFPEKIEAWASGPVVRELYEVHRGMFNISSIGKGDANNLTPNEKETVDKILETYGIKSAQWLSDLTHLEKPWNDARGCVDPGENCDKEITQASMCEYYSSLFPSGEPI